MDSLSPARRSANMRSIRSKGTLPEMTIRRLVYGMGYRYRLHVATLPGKPDLVFRASKKIIDIRGCFWHQHSRCIDSHVPKSRVDYWAPKLEKNQRRDKENQRALRAQGWRILVIWECEVSNPATARRIEKFLME